MRFFTKPGKDPAPLLIGLTAAAVRLVYLIDLAANPFFHHPILDAQHYREWAGKLAGSGFHFFADYQGNPLYPYFLAALIRFLTAGPLLIRIVQHGLGVACCLLLLRSGTILFDRKTGILAGFLYAFYIPAVFYEGWLLPASLTAFLAAAFLTSLLYAGRDRHPRGWIGAGVIGGLLTLARPTLLPVGALFWIWKAGQKPGATNETPLSSWAGGGKAALLLSAGLLLVLVPSSLYLSLAQGETVFVSPHGGVNFYLGNNPQAPDFSRIPAFARGNPALQHQDFQREAERRVGRGLSPAGSSRFWFREGFDFIVSRPGRFLQLLARKIYFFFSATAFSDNYHLPFFRSFFPVLRLPVNFRLLAALGLAGMIAGWKQRRRLALLYFLTASYLVSIALFFVTDRFRIPAAPFLTLFAAGGTVEIIRNLKTRRFAAGLAALFAGIVFWIALRPLGETTASAAADLAAGEVYRRAGRYGEAGAYLEKARAGFFSTAAPDGDICYRIDHGRGEAYLGTGETGKAGEVFQRLREEYAGKLREPDFDIANSYAAHRLYAAARDHYRAELALRPRNYRAWNNLGLALAKQDQAGEGRRAFEQALNLNPDYLPALVNLGNLLVGEGRWAEALERFEAALRIDPSLAELKRATAYCRRRLNRPAAGKQ